MNIVDKLLEKPCYIIDFLPQQVTKDSRGQFFEVEDYLLKNFERYGLKDRIIRIMLKMMCYYSVSINNEHIEQPSPDDIAEIIEAVVRNHLGCVYVLFDSKNALLQFDGDCLHMSVYNPDEEMCEIFEKIAISEGMFWRKA